MIQSLREIYIKDRIKCRPPRKKNIHLDIDFPLSATTTLSLHKRIWVFFFFFRGQKAEKMKEKKNYKVAQL